MMKLQLSSMYGKMGDEILNGGNEMMEWMEHLNQEDVRRIRLVSEALGWKPERVVRTSFTDIILQLAVKVVEMKTNEEHSKYVLESIEQFLEEHKR